MTPKSKKIEIVKELTELTKSAQAIFITGFSGLTVGEISELRKAIRESQGKAKVAKKTLADIAFKKNNINLSVKDTIKEPLMFEFALEDPVALAKILWQFSKQNEKLKILGGYLDGQVLNAQDIQFLAQIPPRNVLLGRLVSSLASPIRNLNYVLNGNTYKLVYVLNALQTKK